MFRFDWRGVAPQGHCKDVCICSIFSALHDASLFRLSVFVLCINNLETAVLTPNTLDPESGEMLASWIRILLSVPYPTVQVIPFDVNKESLQQVECRNQCPLFVGTRSTTIVGYILSRRIYLEYRGTTGYHMIIGVM